MGNRQSGFVTSRPDIKQSGQQLRDVIHGAQNPKNRGQINIPALPKGTPGRPVGPLKQRPYAKFKETLSGIPKYKRHAAIKAWKENQRKQKKLDKGAKKRFRSPQQPELNRQGAATTVDLQKNMTA